MWGKRHLCTAVHLWDRSFQKPQLIVQNEKLDQIWAFKMDVAGRLWRGQRDRDCDTGNTLTIRFYCAKRIQNTMWDAFLCHTDFVVLKHAENKTIKLTKKSIVSLIFSITLPAYSRTDVNTTEQLWRGASGWTCPLGTCKHVLVWR